MLGRLATIALTLLWASGAAAQELKIPNKDGTVKFLVMGDGGTGDRSQRETGAQMARWHKVFKFDFAIMLGDNIYGSERPQDFAKKFEVPYKDLLDAKVEFHAALGNHDDPNQRYYKPFNLGGERYRTFKKGNVRFFVIDSNYLDPEQVKWLQKELEGSGSDWKIPYFHHPLYTTARRGPEVELRDILEPLFVTTGVDVVFSGHEHIYERVKPQKGIYYFTAGGAAKLRKDDTRPGEVVEVGYARDRTFMLVEVDDDEMFFQTITRTGETIDHGILKRREVRPGAAADTLAKKDGKSADSAAKKPAARDSQPKRPAPKDTTRKPDKPEKPDHSR